MLHRFVLTIFLTLCGIVFSPFSIANSTCNLSGCCALVDEYGAFNYANISTPPHSSFVYGFDIAHAAYGGYLYGLAGDIGYAYPLIARSSFAQFVYNGSSFSLQSTLEIPNDTTTANGLALQYHPNQPFMAIGFGSQSNTPYIPFARLQIYDVSGETPVLASQDLVSSTGTPPEILVKGIAWNSTGTMLAVKYTVSAIPVYSVINVYLVDQITGALTLYANSSALSRYDSVAPYNGSLVWDPTEQYLATVFSSGSSAPALQVVQVFKLNPPSVDFTAGLSVNPPDNFGPITAISWAPSAYIACASTQAFAPAIRILKYSYNAASPANSTLQVASTSVSGFPPNATGYSVRWLNNNCFIIGYESTSFSLYSFSTGYFNPNSGLAAATSTYLNQLSNGMVNNLIALFPDNPNMLGLQYVSSAGSPSQIAAFPIIAGGFCPVGLCISKSVSSATPSIGSQVVYTITVANYSSTSSDSVTVSDLIPADLSYIASSASQGSYDPITGIWALGSFPAGGIATLSITVTVNPSASGKTIVNTATVSDPYIPDVYSGDNQASAIINVPKAADLIVGKTVNLANAVVGQELIYTITVTNAGIDSAGAVQVNDLLPSGLSFLSSSPSQGVYNPTSGVWSVGALGVGASATLSITASVQLSAAGQTIVNTASAFDAYSTDIYPGSNTASATTQIAPNADLFITKSASTQEPVVGEVFSYVLTVTNFGANNANAVEVFDLLPAGVNYISSSPSQGTYDPISGKWTVGSLASSASATLTIVVVVDASALGQTITNTATVFDAYIGDIYPGGNTASVTIRVPRYVDLSLTKSVSNSSPLVGDSITYTITLTNNGPYIAQDALVSDVLPSELAFVSSSATKGTYNNTTGIWSVGELAVSEVASLTITATVLPSAGGKTIVNIAQVIDPYDNDPYSSGNSASASIFVSPFFITKVANTSIAVGGQQLVFTITVVNYSNHDLANVAVTDVLTFPFNYVSSSASQGSYNQINGIWTIGTMSASQVCTLTITVQVDGNVSLGSATNTASALDAYGDFLATSLVLTTWPQRFIQSMSVLFWNVEVTSNNGNIVVT